MKNVRREEKQLGLLSARRVDRQCCAWEADQRHQGRERARTPYAGATHSHRRCRFLSAKIGADNSGAMTDEREAAQAALDALRARSAAGERIAQSAIADAVRRAAEADMNAQHTKRWTRT